MSSDDGHSLLPGYLYPHGMGTGKFRPHPFLMPFTLLTGGVFYVTPRTGPLIMFVRELVIACLIPPA